MKEKRSVNVTQSNKAFKWSVIGGYEHLAAIEYAMGTTSMNNASAIDSQALSSLFP
jgi:hypothetical protein